MKDTFSALWALVATPLLAFVFALGGAAIAFGFLEEQYSLTALAIVVVLLAGLLLYWIGRWLLPAHPVAAVWLFQGFVLAIAATTAALGAVAILVGVWLVAPEPATSATAAERAASTEVKALITAVSAALVAFITALATKAEDVDLNIGARVMKAFQIAYPTVENAQGEQIAIPAQLRPQRVGQKIYLPDDSPGIRAVYYDSPWPDWSRTNRFDRAHALRDYLQANQPDDPGSLP